MESDTPVSCISIADFAIAGILLVASVVCYKTAIRNGEQRSSIVRRLAWLWGLALVWIGYGVYESSMSAQGLWLRADLVVAIPVMLMISAHCITCFRRKS